MLKVNLFTSKGIRKGEMTLPSNLFEKENLSILAQAIRVYEDRLHPGLSKTKTRGEVTASTRKIYRQKGTGGARHGSISAPIFVGGGVAHGPKGVKRILKLSKMIRRKSLNIAISLKAKDKELVVVDGISSLKKTKEAASLLYKIAPSAKKELPRTTFVLSEKNVGAKRSLDNLAKSRVEFFKNLNAHKIFHGGLIVVDKEVFGQKVSEGKNVLKAEIDSKLDKRVAILKTEKKSKSETRKLIKSKVKKAVAKKVTKKGKK